MSSQSLKRPLEDDQSAPSRPRKRPGGASRISRQQAEAVQERQKRREAEAQAASTAASTHRGGEEIVRQHYNAVPQRGREWRKTDSKIKGLRSFNNWIKSTMIHKFSKQEESMQDDRIRVLDIGCGKGGDLQKWANSPQAVELYVGIDPAEVSIQQARERYQQMRPQRGGHDKGRGRRVFDGMFLVDDAFANSLGDLPLIQQVGFGPGSRWGPSGGFDIVSMMFCMHYAFESEVKAKGMLTNVASALRKGGRFIGVIPNSDIIQEEVVGWHKKHNKMKEEDRDDHQGKKAEARANGYAATEEDEPAKTKEALPETLGAMTEPATDAPPSNGMKSPPLVTTKGESSKATEPGFAEWGNSIYRVRFPSQTPADGIFRPPYGWKYSYFMEEAVEEVPEYIVPWEAFRAIAEDYNLELQYRKPFREIWEEDGNSPTFGPLSERMGVRGRDGGDLLISDEEMEAASFYHAFCFYKV